MAETRQREQTRRVVRLAAGRLAQHRWLLAGGTAAIIAVHLFSQESTLFTVAAVLALFVVAAFAPRRAAGQHQDNPGAGATQAGLDGLTVEYLAAAVTDPLIIFDKTGAVVHANTSADRAFGALGSGMPLLLKFRTPEMQQAIERILTSASASETVDYSERVPIERVYRVTVSAIGGGSALFVILFKDQSEARRIDRMRADFIANASHELRTPLASIAGFVETLRGPARNDAAARDQFLGIMQNQTQRMARLIDDLLSLSRLEMKSYLAPGAKVDVRSVAESVIDSLQLLATESGVVIERRYGDAPIVVRGDRDELFQVFENLLENACKYGQSGGRVIVSIEAGHEPGAEVSVSIRDFGPGIPEEHIPRITERFYRVDVDTSRAQKGTGLGLSIVKHILTRHHARLTIRSEVGKGAEFTVHLPLA